MAAVDQAVASLGISHKQVLGSNWVDNGQGWLGIRFATAQQVVDLKPISPP